MVSAIPALYAQGVIAQHSRMPHNRFAHRYRGINRALIRPLIRQRAKLDAFFMKRFRTNSLSTWFLRALRHQHHQRFGPEGNYYEFGIGKGRSMSRFLRALKVFCDAEDLDLYSYSLFLFDSFEGMPSKSSPRDEHPGFSKGVLSFSLEQTRTRMSKQLDLSRGNVHFIKGFFDESLTPELGMDSAVHADRMSILLRRYMALLRSSGNGPGGCDQRNQSKRNWLSDTLSRTRHDGRRQVIRVLAQGIRVAESSMVGPRADHVCDTLTAASFSRGRRSRPSPLFRRVRRRRRTSARSACFAIKPTPQGRCLL